MKDNQPSATARLIARSLLLLSQDPDCTTVLSPQSADIGGWFLEACGENLVRFQFLAGQPWFRHLLFWIERSTTPGLWMHYALRKRQIEEAVREALSAGVQQVVVLGAGFDTLAWRLHLEFPDVVFWELDHPATQKPKQAALMAHGMPSDNLHFAAMNLASDRLGNALLLAPKYQSGVSTVFVAEGLLMYLETEQVSDIFRDAHKVSGPGSRFAFTFLEPQEDGRAGFACPSRFVNGWLRRHGEPFRWGIGQTEANEFLERHGWYLQETFDPSMLRRRYLTEEPPLPAVGDLVCLASWKGQHGC